MLTKKLNLTQWGNSYGIRIGKDILKELDIEDENIQFNVEVSNNQIVLTPKRKYPQTIEEAFSDYNGEPLGTEDKYDWGDPVGRELL